MDRRLLGFIRRRNTGCRTRSSSQAARSRSVRGSRHHAHRSAETRRRCDRLRNQSLRRARLPREGARSRVRRRRLRGRDRSFRRVRRRGVLAERRDRCTPAWWIPQSRAVLQPGRRTPGAGVHGLHGTADRRMDQGPLSGGIRLGDGDLLQLLLRAEPRHAVRRRQARCRSRRRIRHHPPQAVVHARRHRHLPGMDERTRTRAAGDRPSAFVFRSCSSARSRQYRCAHHLASVPEQLPLRQEYVLICSGSVW